MSSTIKISTENVYDFSIRLINYLFLFFIESNSLFSGFSENCYQKWMKSMFELIHLRNYNLDFLHGGLNSQFINFNFFNSQKSWVNFLGVENSKFEKGQNANKFRRFEDSNYISISTVLKSFSEFSFCSFQNLANHSTKNMFFMFHGTGSW